MTRPLILVCAVAVAAFSRDLAGQQPGGPGGPPASGWAPIEVGARFGTDNRPGGNLVGGQVWLPVWPTGLVQILPHGDVTFRTGRKEHQVGVDAIVLTGRRRGGVYAGGGLVRRKAVYGDAGEDTRNLRTAVVGFRTPTGTGVPLDLQVDVRWVFADDVRAWRILALGVNVPLWGWDRQ